MFREFITLCVRSKTYIINYISRKKDVHMARRKVGDEQVRKLQRTGEDGGSYMVTLPKEMIAELGWQKKQKVVVKKVSDTLVISDWEG